MSKVEEYLEKDIRGILQPMLFAVLREEPADPVIKIKNNILDSLYG
ncbi:MAG: hypothetical protein MJ252_25345 [archaeon]|nr:hypothetical protein [archaeon]